MEKLVRFRLLSSALSVDEYRLLLSSVLDADNVEEFSSMIFNHFYNKLRKEPTEQSQDGMQIHAVNQKITNIISQRQLNEPKPDTKDDETDNEPGSSAHEPFNITHFADAIIQEIASYLPFKSYSKFQCCCRSIFYAANNPSTLHALDYRVDLSKCLQTDNVHQIQLFMKRFERVQSLSITYLENAKYIALGKFKNLKRLYLQLDLHDHDV
eukprot:760714_1